MRDYRENSDPAEFALRARPPEEDAKLTREEARILFDNPSRAYRYARDVIKGRWPEFERHFMPKIFSGSAFNGGGLWGGAFYDRYDGFGDAVFSRSEKAGSVAERYIRDIVRGPLPEY